MALLSGSLGVSIGDTCVVSSKKLKNYGIGMWTENKWNIRAKKKAKEVRDISTRSKMDIIKN